MPQTIVGVPKEDLEELIRNISYNDLRAIYQKFSPNSPYVKRKNKYLTFLESFSYTNSDQINIDKEVLDEIMEQIEFNNFRNVKSWKKFCIFQNIQLNNINVQQLNQDLFNILSNNETIREIRNLNLKILLKITKINGNINFTLAYEHQPQRKETWIYKFQTLNQVGRIRAKLMNNGILYLNGNAKKVLDALGSSISQHFIEYLNDQQSTLTKKEDIINYIVNTPADENINMVRLRINKPGMQSIEVSITDMNLAKESLCNLFEIHENQIYELIDKVKSEKRELEENHFEVVNE